MKNFLFGVLFTLTLGLMSFKTVQEYITVKPAPIKSAVILSNTRDFSNYIKKGYQVQHLSESNKGFTLIMVKYD